MSTTGDLKSFTYTAVSRSGQRVKQTRTAPSEDVLARVLAAEGWTLISVEEKGTGGFNTDIGTLLNSSGPKMKVADKAVFARGMAQMLAAGLSVSRALEVTASEASKKYKQAILDVREDVLQGSKLSDALANFPGCFDNVFVGYVAVGEESGDLPQTFEKLAQQTEQQNTVRIRIKSVTAYPKMVSGAILLIVVVMLKTVVPQFAGIYASLGSTLPAPTQMVVRASGYISPFTQLHIAPPLITLTLLSPLVVLPLLFIGLRYYKLRRSAYTGSYLEDEEGEDDTTVRNTFLKKTGILLGASVGWNLFIAEVYNRFLGEAIYPEMLHAAPGSHPDVPLLAAFLYQQPFGITLLSPVSWLACYVFFTLIVDYIRFLTRHAWTLRAMNLAAFKMPIFGKLTYRQALYRAVSTLAGGMQSGLQFTRALRLAGDASGSAMFAAACEKIAIDVQSGQQVSDSLDGYTSLFPGSVRALTRAGEESGDMPTMLESAATTVATEIEATVSSLGAKLEVGLLVVMGGVVGVLIVALYLPIFSLANAATQNL